MEYSLLYCHKYIHSCLSLLTTLIFGEICKKFKLRPDLFIFWFCKHKTSLNRKDYHSNPSRQSLSHDKHPSSSHPTPGCLVLLCSIL
jgi:hypothetical protein